MIEIQNLTKSYHSGDTRLTIFQNVDLDILSGSFISIVGPSGSGKSTLLNLLSGIDREFEGTIKLLGTTIDNLSEAQMTKFRGRNISYIFQNFRLIDNLTVEENVDIIVDINKLERNFETSEILKIVGLESKAKNYAYTLSGGESQRVAIARAFVGKTQILLADEPTGALDSTNKHIIMDLIINLHNRIGNTIVMITHDSEVAKLADKLYTLKNNSLEL